MIAFNTPQVTGNPVEAAVGTSATVVCSTDDKGDAVGLWTAWLAQSGPEVVHPKRYVRWQRAVDLALAILLLPVGLVVIGFLVLLVRLTSRGPGIYRQIRVGREGRTFRMYKIRTMRQDAEVGTGAVWAKKDDPRVTLIGRVLRDFHLDEFPQLFNVLKGDMSLIGPRPERPEFVHVLAEKIPGYLNRLAVRPGVTGLAQVNLEPDTDAESVRRKLLLDVEYIRHGSLWMDVRLLLCTFIHMLGISNERSRRLTGVHRDIEQLERFAASHPEDADLSPTPATITAQTPVTPTAGSGQPSPSDESPYPVTNETLNAFTVDVEDYFQVSAFENHVRRTEWDSYASRVESNTRRLLALLDRHEVKATFFVLGWVARRQPRLVREIHAAGHEIGSHGYWHRLIYDQSPDEFRDDVRAARTVLTDITGDDVVAYRAPTFSITNQSLWALDILAEEGFSVDSSIVPVHHDRYGIPGADYGMHTIDTPFGRMVECPPAVARYGRFNFPVGGGGYFRLCPLHWTISRLKAINHKRRQPFVFYIHPWEVDPQQPRMDVDSWTSQFRHRVGLASTERKLGKLLGKFRFGRLCDVIRNAGFDAGSDVDESPTVEDHQSIGGISA